MVRRVCRGINEADTIVQHPHAVGAQASDHGTAGGGTEIGGRHTWLVRDRVGQRTGEIVLDMAPVHDFNRPGDLVGSYAEGG